ncbi:MULTISPECIES: response regulator transcription factor [unclassified Streptomyces]|uniref:response regulator transcription factor n=1 Tax=unclassified Streptomyces TaxID=2593676 RepID=UPI002DDB61B4|nr:MULTISPECIES: response regulator transcription factor [unclassified Streptomyces]WSA92060.1 response regulator transcription factor [Streptomyces sp. NBC_01795]WSB76426.1 response regulator transcription factor [Streptomyces sp. NBC_01775]WSS44142.1 response regulator transcription factor [Streptomyces sp. NBC_01187]
MPTRVLVVDDQVLIRAGVAALLRAAPGMEVVGEASDGDEAVQLAEQHRPDVVLMDIRMPGTSGITATERILETVTDPRPRVLVLTTFDLDEYVYAALRAGACGFLLKDTGPQRLLAAIAAVCEGDTLFSPSVTRRLIEAYAPRTEPGARTPETLEVLTGRELDVLRLVAGGLSNPEIAEALVISESTVKTHLNRTMAKLGLGSRAQAVVLAYESGLVTPGGGHAGA